MEYCSKPWYGIPDIETLFAVMGTGCISVVRVNTPDTNVVVGTCESGRCWQLQLDAKVYGRWCHNEK